MLSFPRISPAFYLVLRIKVALSYFGLNPIACKFHRHKARSRSTLTNELGALFEILSFLLDLCTFTHTRSQYIVS